MTESAEHPEPIRIVTVGPDGQPVNGTGPAHEGIDEPDDLDDEASQLAAMVEQPAKVMRIGSMIKQLLEEVKSAPLDDASRVRLREVHENSIHELASGLAPELRAELDRLTLPFSAELRIAQAQLVGWLEGLFHGIQTALFAQQMAARAQLEQMRRQALPQGSPQNPQQGPGLYL
jgi:hypothetical protein